MLGTAIYTLMKERNLTQAELAKAVGVSQATISAIINGTSKPRQSTLESIAKALGTVVADLEKDFVGSLPEKIVCPRCDSTAVVEFCNHSTGTVRMSCGFCGLDSKEQRNRAEAYRVFSSFRPSERSVNEMVHVMTLTELLDSNAFDSYDVRDVWFENRGLFITPALMQYGVSERELDCVRVWWWNGNGHRSFELGKYGTWWRCWSGRPTEAQSDGVPWATE